MDMKREMKMDYITFTHADGQRVVEIKNPTGSTWMDLADDFVGFLVACGYVVDREDVAMHLAGDHHPLAEFHTDQLDLTLYDQVDTIAGGNDLIQPC